MEEIMKQKPVILLPLTGIGADSKVVLPAKSLSELLGASVHLLYISDEAPTPDLLARLKISTDQFPEFIVTHKSGDAAEIILEETKNSDYLILNSDNINPVIIRIIENSDIPVILLTPHTKLELHNQHWKPKRILFPLDGSLESAQAVDACLEIIMKSDPDINVLHILTPKEIHDREKEASPGALYYQDHPHHDWEVWMKDFLKRFFPHKFNPQKMSICLSKGKAATAILDFTKKSKVDMIVMAWQGIFREDHALILKDILGNTSCPVFLTKIKKNKPTQYIR